MLSRVLVMLVFCAAPLRAEDAVEAFEKSVRPLFLEHCAKCHGEKKQSAGLRLDTVAGIRAGADDGPVIVAGKPNESRLIMAVRHEGEHPMPAKKLPAESIAILEAWVAGGAAMPKEAAVVKTDASKHWAFQPVKASDQSIDDFITQKLKVKGLTLSRPADKRTLLIRTCIDLIGLPPTMEECEAFEKDNSPNAFEKVVDRLLSSPQYGERWARHWLDVARYSDTKGYVFTEDRNFPYAYTYRDYVINAFNDDKPFNKFIVEQIAADKLNLGEDNRPLAAMGFLTLGRRFNNNIHDIIDDRIEVVMRGFLGLSVGCARCHDHKFDPIPIADYYSLYGVFASSVEVAEPPILSGQPRTAETVQFEQELARLEKVAADYLEKITKESLQKYRGTNAIAEYLIGCRDTRGLPPAKYEQILKDRNLNRIILERWRKRLDAAAGKNDPVLEPWLAFAGIPDAEFAAQSAKVRSTLLKNDRLNPLVIDALRDISIASLADIATLYGEQIVYAGEAGKPNPLTALLDDVLDVTDDEADNLTAVPLKSEYRKLRNTAQKFKATSPNAPARPMSMTDAPRPSEPVVFLRGNPGNRGPKVPRQFLSALDANRKPFSNGSGRLELANAIASPDNPLTARVIVNRVWAWHFGYGLVRTPSDFGLRSDPPSHPELLDALAAQFMKDGWSLKSLHRRIVLSQTYRQSSRVTESIAVSDPENVLLSHAPRRRLEFEALRDRMLMVAGMLDTARVGGRSVDIFKAPFSGRRSVYEFIERQNLPATLRAFDLANPDQHSPERYRTTVPQQALFLMNSPFAAEVAKRTLMRPEVAEANEDERITAIYRAVLCREATAKERERALKYVTTAPAAEGHLGPWEQLVQALVMSNEFAFAD